MKSWKVLAYLLPMLFSISTLSPLAWAQGGPPLATDDPDTPGDGHWEINTAMQVSESSWGTVFQLPQLDVNYGYGDHVQLNLVTSFNFINEYGVGATSGMSMASLAAKWRFCDQENCGVALSTYPRADFHHDLASRDLAVNPLGTRYFLPFELSWELTKFGINPEIGYASYTDPGLASEWVYGLAMNYGFHKNKEVLFEVHGRSTLNEREHEGLAAVGVRYRLMENLIIIESLTRKFQTYSDDATAWTIYLGIQIRR